MSLFAELKRRNIFCVGAAMLLIAMLIQGVLLAGTGRIQAADTPLEPASPGSTDKSIAVLPFAVNSPRAKDAEVFSDGIHAGLLRRLQKIHGLKVISMPSVMAYRDSTKSLREIGKELNAGNLLEGVVEQNADRIRFVAQLFNAETEESLWSESRELKLETQNLFDLQREIAYAVAARLGLPPAETEVEISGKIPTTNLDAYRAVLQSRQMAGRGGTGSVKRGIAYARTAIGLDPEYADAYLALATTLSWGINSRVIAGDEPRAEFTTAIDTAMSLKPDFDEAWLTLGYYQNSAGLPGAEESFKNNSP